MGELNTTTKERAGVKSDAETKTAKLFKNGRSQAVRLPKEFRFEGTEVAIRRGAAMGEVVLSPNAESRKNMPWPELFRVWDALELTADDVLERDQSPPVDRDFF